MAAPCSQWIACSPVWNGTVAGRSTRSLDVNYDMEAVRATPIVNAFLIISVTLGVLLLLGAASMGAEIFYLGGTILGTAGALLAMAYLISAPHRWRIKVIGVVSLLVNGGVFVWLFWAAILTWGRN